MDSNATLFSKITKYIPVIIILLSLTFIVGYTFAYFTDTKDEQSVFTMSKVELSSETTTGLSGEIFDVIPGTPITNGSLKFSKSIDSEAIYVRAKLSFSLPYKYQNDEDMIQLLDLIRSSTQFGIVSEVQNNAVWSEKQGNYFYLMEPVSEGNPINLKRVDGIDTYILANEIVIPRDLKQLENNEQYMKSINFHIAFEAIQADNVSNMLSDTKEIFNSIFPEIKEEKVTTKVTFKDLDLVSNYSVVVLEDGMKLSEPVLNLPVDENGTSTKALVGWYTDSALTNKFDFNAEIADSVILYPNVVDVSSGLSFTSCTRNGISGYSVSKGTCNDVDIVIPDFYNGKPIIEIKSNAFSNNTNLNSVVMPDSIMSIGSSAFSGCTNLNIKTLPKNIENVEMRAFQDCKLLDNGSVYYLLINITNEVVVLDVKDESKEIVWPENTIIIGGSAFYSTDISFSKLPESLKVISSQSFSRCYNIKAIECPNGLTTIGFCAFEFSGNIEYIYIPETCVNISSAFYACNKLKYVICESDEVVNLMKDKVDNSCIYVLQDNDNLLEYSEITIGNITIATATDNDGYKWVRTADNKYYKCIAI